MGERIDFPHNEQFYLQTAQRALEQQQVEDAIDILEKGLLQTQSSLLLTTLSELLQKEEEWSELLWLFEEQYLQRQEEPLLYYHSLLYTQQFERLERELQQVEDVNFPEKRALELQLHVQKLGQQQHELERLTVLQALLQDTTRVISSEECSYYCHWLAETTLTEKEVVFEDVLLDKRFSLFDKAMIIDTWVIDGQRSSLRLLRGSEEVTLYREQLSALSSSQWLQNPLTAILRYMDAEQLELAEVLAEKLRQDVIRLYPFSQESIGELDEWICYFNRPDQLVASLYETDEQLLASYQAYQKWRQGAK